MSDLNKTTQLKRTLSLPLLIMFGLAYLAPTVVFNYYGIFTNQQAECTLLHLPLLQ